MNIVSISQKSNLKKAHKFSAQKFNNWIIISILLISFVVFLFFVGEDLSFWIWGKYDPKLFQGIGGIVTG